MGVGHKKANETVDKKKEATWAKQGISYLLLLGSKRDLWPQVVYT